MHEVPLTFPGKRHLVLCMGVGSRRGRAAAAGAGRNSPFLVLAAIPGVFFAEIECGEQRAVIVV